MACMRLASSCLLLMHTVAGDRPEVKQNAGSNTSAGTGRVSVGMDFISEFVELFAKGLTIRCSSDTLLQMDAKDDQPIVPHVNSDADGNDANQGDSTADSNSGGDDENSVFRLVQIGGGVRGFRIVSSTRRVDAGILDMVARLLEQAIAEMPNTNLCSLSADEVKQLVAYITAETEYHSLIDVLLISVMSQDDPTTETCGSNDGCAQIKHVGFKITQFVGDQIPPTDDADDSKTHRALMSVKRHLRDRPVVIDTQHDVFLESEGQTLDQHPNNQSISVWKNQIPDSSQKLFALARGDFVQFCSQSGLAKHWNIERTKSNHVQELSDVLKQIDAGNSEVKTKVPDLLSASLKDFTDMQRNPLQDDLSIFRLDPV